jgi:hypothetical protein
MPYDLSPGSRLSTIGLTLPSAMVIIQPCRLFLLHTTLKPHVAPDGKLYHNMRARDPHQKAPPGRYGGAHTCEETAGAIGHTDFARVLRGSRTVLQARAPRAA